LLALLVRIESLRAGLAKSEAELLTRKEIQELTRTVVDDPLALERARQLDAPSSALGLSLRSEYPNPTYGDLDRRVAIDRGELAQLEQQKEQLVDVRKLNQPRLAVLTRLYDAEMELQKREDEYKLVHGIYDQIAARYELARLDFMGRSAQLTVIDPSLPPDRPLGRGTVVNTSVGFVLGLLFGGVAMLIRGVR